MGGGQTIFSNKWRKGKHEGGMKEMEVKRYTYKGKIGCQPVRNSDCETAKATFTERRDSVVQTDGQT